MPVVLETVLLNETIFVNFVIIKWKSTLILEIIPPLFSGGAKTRGGGSSQGLKENTVKVLLGGQSIPYGAKTRGGGYLKSFYSRIWHWVDYGIITQPIARLPLL